jgi:adenylate cyclase, class 2
MASELEVKLYLTDLPALEQKLKAMGAPLIQLRTHELNLRFDTQDGRLSQAHQTLRLRRDSAARMTFKDRGLEQSGVRARTEIEFIASDFEAAQAFLEGLGYAVYLVYEKYRAVYDLDGVHITLDELPYGTFAEIEGPDPLSIRAACLRLELDWEARSLQSYTALFHTVCKRRGLDLRDLTFQNFAGISLGPDDLGLLPADI